MSENVKLWRVIDDGRTYGMIPDHHDTDHKVVATGLTKNEATNICYENNSALTRKKIGNIFTGLMHISAEAAGHCVKTVKDGYEKGRK